MTKNELISAIVSATGLKKAEIDEVLDQLRHEIYGALYRGEEAVLPGLGKFAVVARAARSGRNPATGAVIEIPEKNVPHFKATKELRDSVSRF